MPRKTCLSYTHNTIVAMFLSKQQDWLYCVCLYILKKHLGKICSQVQHVSHLTLLSLDEKQLSYKKITNIYYCYIQFGISLLNTDILAQKILYPNARAKI